MTQEERMQERAKEIQERMRKMNTTISDDELEQVTGGGGCGPEPKFIIGDWVCAPRWDFYHRRGTITRVGQWGHMWTYDVHWEANEEGPEEDEADIWETQLEAIK